LSGLKPRWWLEELLKTCASEGRTSGGAFNNADGTPASPSEYNAMVRHYFKLIQDTHPALLDPEEELIADKVWHSLY
jgi:hypothetical protein